MRLVLSPVRVLHFGMRIIRCLAVLAVLVLLFLVVSELPATVIKKARRRLCRNGRGSPPHTRFSAISTGTKMPEDPQTTSTIENTSSVLAMRPSEGRDVARACP